MHMNKFVWKEKYLVLNRQGALKRTRTGVNDGCRDATVVHSCTGPLQRTQPRVTLSFPRSCALSCPCDVSYLHVR